ncbi:MAG: hypothetical protein NT119_02940 [Actinobacteria bacterium]|nr:hypothetical protein [Actinomycetota bacterium]
MRRGKVLQIVVAHVTPYFQSVHTVVRRCTPSTHTLSAVLAVGAIVVATSSLMR